MGTLAGALDRLEPEQQARVLRWAGDRYDVAVGGKSWSAGGDVGAGAEEEEEKEEKASRGSTSLDVDGLVEQHESDKDSENALLVLAVYYARHGKGPFELTALKAVATELKLTVPDRMDKFFARHKRDSKEVLRKQADGWKVTPSGETWLKSTYGVTRGKTAPHAGDL